MSLSFMGVLQIAIMLFAICNACQEESIMLSTDGVGVGSFEEFRLPAGMLQAAENGYFQATLEGV